MNGFGTIDKKDINVLISSIENKINFIRNDISQNVTNLKNQLNACNEELNRLKKLVIQVTDYNDTEYKIRQSIKSQSKGHTAFIISHRVSSFENCDIILVVQNGKIVDKGRHEELISRAGYYREVWEEQRG